MTLMLTHALYTQRGPVLVSECVWWGCGDGVCGDGVCGSGERGGT